jgi:hypothetical protein
MFQPDRQDRSVSGCNNHRREHCLPDQDEVNNFKCYLKVATGDLGARVAGWRQNVGIYRTLSLWERDGDRRRMDQRGEILAPQATARKPEYAMSDNWYYVNNDGAA